MDVVAQEITNITTLTLGCLVVIDCVSRYSAYSRLSDAYVQRRITEKPTFFNALRLLKKYQV